MTTWQVRVDVPPCVGSGMCAGIAPDVFRVEGGRALATEGPLTASDEIIDAWESCPTSAIHVLDGSGTEIEPDPSDLEES